MANQTLRIVFFGGEPLGPASLQALVRTGLTPELVVCNPDRRSGRGLELTPPRIKTWATEHNIEVFQPESFKDREALTRITETTWDLFVVVAYNFILPKWFLELQRSMIITIISLRMSVKEELKRLQLVKSFPLTS